MNSSDQPVTLIQKIEYLTDKINQTHRQVKQGEFFELKMRFIQFIDTSIERIYAINRGTDDPEHQNIVKKKYEQYYSAVENEREKERITTEKELLAYRMKELNVKEQELQVQSLRIQVENERILKERIHKEYVKKQGELKSYIVQLEKKVKGEEKQMEKLLKLNSAQAKQIDLIKEERNRAEKRQIQMREKYDNQIGYLETFQSKKHRYNFRSTEDLRNLRIFTNVSNDKKNQQKFVICDVPFRFHVVKILYGIKLCVVLPGGSVHFFNEVLLYQKEDMQISAEGTEFIVRYIKRKVELRMDRPAKGKPTMAILMYGKGDSVAIDQSI